MEGEEYSFSRFAKEFDLENTGYVALYHSLNMQLVFIKKDMRNKLKKFIDNRNLTYRKSLKKLVKELLSKKILIPKKFNEEKYLDIIKKDLGIGSPHLQIMYLLLTDKCNFACKYCYIELPLPKGHRYSLMSKKTAKKAVELFIKTSCSKTPRTIIFYGGEPLLNKEVVFYTAKLIRDIEKKKNLGRITLQLITNGSLIDKTVTKDLKKYGFEISVSLDGWEEVNDEFRIYKNGKGTFKDIVKGIENLKEAGIDPGISCSISFHNYKILPEIVGWFNKEFETKAIGFNPLLDVKGIKKPQILEVNKYLLDAFEIAREKGIYEDRIMRKVNAFVNKEIKPNDCGGCGNQIVVFPNGDLGICHAFIGENKYIIGHVNDDDIDLNHKFFIEWSNRSPLNIPECMDCFALGLCGGGCVHNSYVKHKDIWKVDEEFCIHSKEALNWLIRDLFKIISSGKHKETDVKTSLTVSNLC